MKKVLHILLTIVFFCCSAMVSGQYFSGFSNYFDVDTDVPYVSNWCPEEGAYYLPGQEIYLYYYISEGNLTSVELGFSSEINGEIEIIGTLPPEGPVYITIPDVITSFANLYIIVKDDFGHENYNPVPAYGYFNIGAASQVVTVPQGWSGLSSCYVPQNVSMTSIFGSYLDDLIIVQDLQNVFWPGGNVFTLNEWDTFQGYLIKAQNSFEMEFLGSSPECDQYGSVPEGWGLIPVVAGCDLEAESFFNWNLWSSVILKEAAGWRVFWPEYEVKSLQILERGKSYFVYSTMANNDFSFMPCWEGGKATFPDKPDIPKVWNQPAFTPNSHVFAIPPEVIAGAGIGMNWVLGAFSMNGLCVGVVPAEAFHLTVFAEDPSTEIIDGLITGETVFFRAWNPDKEIEVGLIPEFDMNLPQNGVFQPNGISAITCFKFGAVGIDEINNNLISIYPNPASDELLIETGNNCAYLVTISDINGSPLMTHPVTGKINLNISQLPQGVYFVKAANGESVITQKLLIN